MNTQDESKSGATLAILRSRLALLDHISASSDRSDISLARNVIQDELLPTADSAAAKSILKSRLNELNPVARLNTDILYRIFESIGKDELVWGLDVSSKYIGPPTSLSRRLGWIKVSYVCRAWRQTALDHPLLWRNITFRLGVHWAEELLSRSKAVPIKVTFTSGDPQTWAMPYFAEHLTHTQELTLYFRHPAVQAILLQSHAPKLEMLTLDLYSRVNRLTSLPTAFSEFSWLCLDRMPCLQTLMIKNTVWLPFAPEWAAHTNLTLLHIDNSRVDVKLSQLHQGGLVDALSKMPHLEKLFFNQCLADVTESGPTVTLPHLCRLTIADMVTRVASFIQRLRIVNIALKVAFELYSLPDDVSILQSLMAHQTDFTSPLSQMAIYWTNSGVNTSFWRFENLPPGVPTAYRSGDKPDLQIRFTCVDPPDIVLSVLPLRHVRVLCVASTEGWVRDTWLRAHRQFSNVEHIVAQTAVPTTLIEALFPPPHSPLPGQNNTEVEQTLLAPRLTLLTLQSALTPDPTALLALKAARAKAGCPLEIIVSTEAA
ncbi:hypothetical protein BV25DRAFT_1915172 [Artomyces pyxidatus]|uniref:Uncharacterized protein n=1 Tax=Artomyces pyxidatus TaxID=48021 RepID=A0ACB8T6Z2_9AGAM|nr:hypothetical protein BV25DRAFT_1915172 [Artomyces pyxidatus]